MNQSLRVGEQCRRLMRFVRAAVRTGDYQMSNTVTRSRQTLIVATACMCAAGAASAEFRSLDQAALKEAVAGKTLRLQTRMGAIPITFRADGTMSGRAPDLVGYLGRGQDSGTWWVSADKLCQKWKIWLDAQAYCFTLRQSGSTVQWQRDDGLRGTMTVVSN